MAGDYTPVAAWPCRWMCDVSGASPYVTGTAVKFASDVLWALSGRQFGFTTVTLRPADQQILDTPFPDAWLSWPGTQPPPLGANGSGGYYGYWVNAIGCGTSEIKLPAPVHAITAVKIAGVTLATSAYRLDDNRKLVRIDGFTWPASNNLNVPDTAVGGWSITAQYGLTIPDGAEWAIGELGCEFIKAINGEDCRLPRNVSSIARQGVTIQMPDISTFFTKGVTGLYLTDMFITTWNPKRLRARAKTFSVDVAEHRRAT